MQRPSEDRHLHTQSELQHRICVLLGGIAAEEMIYQETSTGAQNDLERSSDIARRMVTEFGMSPRLGRVNFRESGRSPFAIQGYAPVADQLHSEQTRREIDIEVKRIIDEAGQTVQTLLQSRRAILEQLSRELFEKELLDAEDLRRIVDQHTTTPQLVPGTEKRGQVPFHDTPAASPELPPQADIAP
jgi:cell division protease FtsH